MLCITDKMIFLIKEIQQIFSIKTFCMVLDWFLILPILDIIGGLNFIIYSYTIGACTAVLVFNKKFRL